VDRIESNVLTGESTLVTLTQAEVDEANARTAAMEAVEAPIRARLSTDAQECTSCRLDSTIMNLVNQTKAEWLTWASNNFPTLTAAEKTRLGNLFWVVALGVRREVRYG
jgi:hypothetical protein